MSFMSAKIERETDTRGVRWWPAIFYASRYSLVCLACWTWNGSPLSSAFSVGLCRFMPICATQTAVALDADPN